MKISTPIRISGQGVWIPHGRIDPEKVLSQEEFKEHQYISLYHDEENHSLAHMAYASAMDALKDAKVDAKQVDLLVFAQPFVKDKTLWSQSADLAARLGHSKTSFLDIFQACNGTLTGVELFISKTMMDLEVKTGLIASAMRLPPKMGTKWNSNYQNFYGDGGGSWVLEKKEGAFQILSLHAAYDARLNDLIYINYGSLSDIDADFTGREYGVQKAKKQFIEKHGKPFVEDLFDQVTEEAVLTCINDAQLSYQNIDYVVLPNFSKKLSESIVTKLDFKLSQSSWEFGRQAGHMSSVDPVMNLYHAHQQKRIKPGDHVLILTQGGGISVMSMIVRV